MGYPLAYKYRDYVIRAFNQDKPYDRFISEQLAGNVMPASAEDEAYFDQLMATGFLMVGPKVLAEQDREKFRMDIIDEQLDVTAKALMGQTLGCARCHDHKFDPIPTSDYYALAGILKSTRVLPDGYLRPPLEQPLARPDRIAAHREHAERTSAAEDAFEAAVTEQNELIQRRWRQDLSKYLLAATELRELAEPIADEAENFADANLEFDDEDYGDGIGVIYFIDRDQVPRYVEWKVHAAAAGDYHFALRYTWSFEPFLRPRPILLSVNGARGVELNFDETSGMHPPHQRWSVLAARSSAKKSVTAFRCAPHGDLFKIEARSASAGPKAIHSQSTSFMDDPDATGRNTFFLLKSPCSNRLGTSRA